MKKTILFLLCLLVISGCTNKDETIEEETEMIQSIIEWDQNDIDSNYQDEDVQDIIFKKDTIEYDGKDAIVSDTTFTITKAGTYQFSGTLEDGSIIVDADTEALVRIILNDTDITCQNSAPIYVKQADKVLLTLADNSTNIIRDGNNYQLEDAAVEEPNAAIFAKDDLTINGNGSLQVEANYNNGIQSKDDLKITSGHITITSQDDGLVGKDVLAIKNGTISLQTGGDGMKTTNEEDNEKGNLVVENGTISIVSQTDGMQSANGLYLYQGNVNIISGGGSVNSSTTAKDNPWETTTTDCASTKGLKSLNILEIANGTFTLDTLDDAIHTNGVLTINDGSFQIKSGDDGIHADTSLTINGGTINIEQSYEGIESSELHFIDGTIHVKASDDGLNAAGGNDGSSTNGRPGQNNFTADASKQIIIDGGYLYVDAQGDGIDSNGTITMNGGTVLINGPEDSGNGALDFDGEFTITGGYLIAAGSSGMLQSPTTISNGNCVVIGFNTNTNDLVYIKDDTHTIVAFQPAKTIQSLVVYSPELKTDNTYEIYLDGTPIGTNQDGLYEDASGGTLNESFTISSSTTTIGTISNMMREDPGNRGNNAMPRP